MRKNEKRDEDDHEWSSLPGRVKRVEAVNNWIILAIILLAYKQLFGQEQKVLYVPTKDILSVQSSDVLFGSNHQKYQERLEKKKTGMNLRFKSDDTSKPTYIKEDVDVSHSKKLIISDSLSDSLVQGSRWNEPSNINKPQTELGTDHFAVATDKKSSAHLAYRHDSSSPLSYKDSGINNILLKKKNENTDYDRLYKSKLDAKRELKHPGDKHILDYGSKNSAGGRKLQIEGTNTTCNGTLFHLELRLGQKIDQKSWELWDDNSTSIVAVQNFRFVGTFEQKSFTTCLVPGPYTFILKDESGREFSCDFNGPRCYDIFLNNQLLLKGHSFVGRAIEHKFDSSAPCVIANTVVLNFDQNTSDAVWSIRDSLTGETVSFESFDQNNNDTNSTKESYLACMPAGSYSYEIFPREDQQLSCNHTNTTDECFSMTINDAVFMSQNENFSRTSGLFYISKDGYGHEEICPLTPILAPLNSFNGHIFDETISRKLDLIYSLSSFDDVHNPSTSQYKAACWMIYDDTHQNDVLNNNWIERYVFSVLLYAMNEVVQILPKHICDYDKTRVECDTTGQIKAIDFGAMNIQGTIPPEMTFFRQLELLDLNSNNLVGSIPSTLGELIRLKELRLEVNNLDGTLFSEIGNLINLEVLTIGSNFIEGPLPFQLGSCKSLKLLRANGNKLEGQIPAHIYDLINLHELSLSNNNLGGTISPRVIRLDKLQFAHLENNEFQGNVPSEIGILPLQELILSNNVFTGTFPGVMGSISSLELLLMSNNMLSGTISDSFQNSHNLTTIDLSSNLFTGTIPSSIWALDNLREINLKDNMFKGEVAIDDCSKYDVLGIDNSMWLDDKPIIDCTCCDIEECHVWEITGTKAQTPCPLSNSYSFKFYNLYRIKDIHSRSIQSRGKFAKFDEAQVCLSPTGCYTFSYRDETRTTVEYDRMFSSDSNNLVRNGQCSDVSICGVDFSSSDPRRVMLNHLTQTVDVDIMNPNSIKHQSLCWILTEDNLIDAYNVCDGSLLQRYVIATFYLSTGFVSNLKELGSKDTCEWAGIKCNENGKFVEEISLRATFLNGSIIKEIGYLSHLKVLDLSQNNLGGIIDPFIIEHLPNLEIFSIEDNFIKGELPKDLFSTPKLREIRVKNNLFTGSLPDSIQYSKDLEHFDVSNNILRGTLSPEMFAPLGIKYIDISENVVRGTIPSEIGMLERLNVLKLSRNRLSGSIPSEMFNAKFIGMLLLQGNLLTGSLPTSIGNLENAMTIWINHNSLKGSIPTELSNLQNVGSLFFHSNKFTGTAPRIDSPDFEFFADCKSVLDFDCPSCTLCCDDQEDCTPYDSEAESLWQDSLLQFLAVPLASAFLLLNWHCFARWCNWNCLPRRDPLTIYSDDSVYSYIFTRSPVAWCIHFVTLGLQLSLYFTFLWASDPTNPSTLLAATFKCLWDSDDCVVTRVPIQPLAWLLFFIMTGLYLIPDIVDGFLQIRMAFESPFSMRFMINGFFLMALSTVSITASYSFNFATAATTTDLVINAVILLFINDLDEQTMACLEKLVPEWNEARVEEVHKYMKARQAVVEETEFRRTSTTDKDYEGSIQISSPVSPVSEQDSTYVSARSEVNSPSSFVEDFSSIAVSTSFDEANLTPTRKQSKLWSIRANASAVEIRSKMGPLSMKSDSF